MSAKRVDQPTGRGQPGGDLDDGVLLQRAGTGDQLAFSALLDRHLPAMLAVARRMLRDDAEAEDVAQEAMLRMWRSSDRLKAETLAVEAELGDTGRLLIRPSGTEPLVRVMVEARDAGQALACAERLSAALRG